MKKKLSIYFGILVATVCIVATTVFVAKNNVDISDKKAELGESAVKLLYQFRNADELNRNMTPLSLVVTKPVFNQLTIDNEERTLNTYLKFEGKPVEVNIIKSTDSYVIYNLNTEKISSERVFIFMFDVDSTGKICFVREVEAIDFISSVLYQNN